MGGGFEPPKPPSGYATDVNVPVHFYILLRPRVHDFRFRKVVQSFVLLVLAN